MLGPSATRTSRYRALMAASEKAIAEAAAIYASILDDPVRSVEIRAVRERYAAELAARAEQEAHPENE